MLKQTIAFIATCCLITNVLAITTTPDPEPVPDTGSGGALDDGRYVFINRFSNRAMEVVNASSQSGANVAQYTYNGGSHQQWDVVDLGNGSYSIQAAHSGKALDVWEWNAEDGADVRQWDSTGAVNQQWKITSVGNGLYSVTSSYSGKALEVFDFNGANGGNVSLWSYWGGDTQLWSIQVANGSTPSPTPTPTPTPTPVGKGSSCQSTGSVTVSSTIVVNGGVYDGGCRTFNPTSVLGDGGQSEGQKPVFRVENGGTLRNVIIGNNGADGIHIYGGGTVENVRWNDVGEDALTVKEQGNVTLRNIEGYKGYDKFLQINAPTNLTVENCIVDDMGKFLRQNGGTSFTINVTVDNCDISNMKEGVFRTDSSSSTAKLSNSRLRNAGQVCIGAWRSCSTQNVSNF